MVIGQANTILVHPEHHLAADGKVNWVPVVFVLHIAFMARLNIA